MAKSAAFFDTDFAKLMDVSKLMSDYKVPGLDIDALLATQRKNIEALTAATQLGFEGMQAVLRRQAEIMRQSVEQTSTMVNELLVAGTPEDKVAKQADLVKLAFERSLANVRELSALLAKSGTEASDVITKRIGESLDELKVAIQKTQK